MIANSRTTITAPVEAGAICGAARCVRERPHAPGSRTPRFALGRVLATPGALRALADAEQRRGHGARRSGAVGLPAGSLATDLLARHVGGDWGELDADDWRANDAALTSDARLLSAYVLPSGVRLWIITEADRSASIMCIQPASGSDAPR